jgi:hypothetical protein
MSRVSRREFLKWAGAGSVALAGVAAGAYSLLGKGAASAVRRLVSPTAPYRFRAAAGVPSHPLPAYASFVVEGAVDPATGTGRFRKALFAGAPEAMSTIEFPGTSRWFRVTGVREKGTSLLVRAVAEDSGSLARGEGLTALVRVDRSARRVIAPLINSDIELRLTG